MTTEIVIIQPTISLTEGEDFFHTIRSVKSRLTLYELISEKKS